MGSGTTEFEAADRAPFPTLLVACTRKVYGVPLDRPVTITDRRAPSTVAVWPADDVTVYDVMVEPPVSAGATHVTVAEPFPGVEVTEVGTPGRSAGGMTPPPVRTRRPGAWATSDTARTRLWRLSAIQRLPSAGLRAMSRRRSNCVSSAGPFSPLMVAEPPLVRCSTNRAVTGDGVDGRAAGGVQPDPADPGTMRLGDVQGAVVVAGDAAGLVEVGVDGEIAVTVAVPREVGRRILVGLGGGDVTGDGRDRADAATDRGDLPDEVVAPVGDVDGAVVGHPEALGVAEFCVPGVVVGAAVAVVPGPVGPGHPGHLRRGTADVDRADHAVARVGDPQGVDAVRPGS